MGDRVSSPGGLLDDRGQHANARPRINSERRTGSLKKVAHDVENRRRHEVLSARTQPSKQVRNKPLQVLGRHRDSEHLKLLRQCFSVRSLNAVGDRVPKLPETLK